MSSPFSALFLSAHHLTQRGPVPSLFPGGVFLPVRRGRFLSLGWGNALCFHFFRRQQHRFQGGFAQIIPSHSRQQRRLLRLQSLFSRIAPLPHPPSPSFRSIHCMLCFPAQEGSLSETKKRLHRPKGHGSADSFNIIMLTAFFRTAGTPCTGERPFFRYWRWRIRWFHPPWSPPPTGCPAAWRRERPHRTWRC